MAKKLGTIFFVLLLTIRPALSADDGSDAELVLKITDHAKLLHKMKSLVIDQIDWKNLSVQDAVKSLAAATKRCDPRGEGINFVLTRPDLPQRITLKLKNATVPDIIQQMGLAYSVREFAICVWPDNGEGLTVRTFTDVDSSFVQFKPDLAGDESKHAYDVRDQLRAKGAIFAPGTSAFYLPEKKELIVTNDPDQIELIDELLYAATGAGLHITKGTKFIEL